MLCVAFLRDRTKNSRQACLVSTEAFAVAHQVLSRCVSFLHLLSVCVRACLLSHILVRCSALFLKRSTRTAGTYQKIGEGTSKTKMCISENHPCDIISKQFSEIRKTKQKLPIGAIVKFSLKMGRVLPKLRPAC